MCNPILVSSCQWSLTLSYLLYLGLTLSNRFHCYRWPPTSTPPPNTTHLRIPTQSVDGTDIRQLDLQWLRSRIGVVTQEPVLFDMSIRDNIAYGSREGDVQEADIVEAARQANIHSFVETLPEVSEHAQLRGIPDRGKPTYTASGNSLQGKLIYIVYSGNSYSVELTFRASWKVGL